MKHGQLRMVDCGRYGQALAWVRPNRPAKIVEIELMEKTGGIRTVRPSAALVEQVKRALRRS